jgi:hypothetical protein
MKKRKILILGLAMLIACFTQIKAQEISPFLFGQNHWLANGDEGRVGYLNQLWPKVKASGVKIIRIGGNGYERNFPDRERLNRMIDSIQGIGAEPILQVSRFFTALQAKELVEYYTKGDGRKVTYWSIGNEPLLHDEETLEIVHEFILRLATAMKEVSPEIKIFVFDEAGLRMPEYGELCGGSMDITGLKVNGQWLIDGFSFHNYPNGIEFNRDDVVFKGPQSILNDIKQLNELIEKANEKHRRIGEEGLMWGLTEFNVTWSNPDRETSGYGNPSFLGGQFIAEIFGYGMQYGAHMMNMWCINETDAVSTDFGYLGFPREFYPRSSYYHMQMMSENMQGRFVPSGNNKEYVKTIASSDSEKITLIIMNQHNSENYNFEVNLNGKTAKSKADLIILVNGKITKTYTGSIPNQSTLLLVFDKSGNLIKKMEYNLALNIKNLPPLTTENKNQ